MNGRESFTVNLKSFKIWLTERSLISKMNDWIVATL